MNLRSARPHLALRVGITGHRWREAQHGPTERLDRRDAAAVQASLRTILARIRSATMQVHSAHADLFDEAAPTLSLVSAMAEGSDELAAMVASEKGSGYVLDVVAPYDLPRHAPRFSEGSEALRLWNGARSRLVLDGVPLADEPSGGGVRHEATLVETNRRLVWNCDLLIAVWDGLDSRGDAGTARVIARARVEELPIVHIHANDPARVTVLGDADASVSIEAVVMRLLTPPLSSAADVGVALVDYRRESPPGVVVRSITARVYGVAMKFLTFFDGVVKVGGIPPSPDACPAPWQPIAQLASASERRARVIDPAFQRADYYAAAYGARHRATFTTILFAAPFAVVCAWLGSLAPPDQRLRYAIGELVLLGMLTLFFVRSSRLRFHAKWLDYRLLAERLRHHGFLWPLGRTSPIVRVPTHAPRTDPRPAWVNWWYRAVSRDAGLAPVVLDATSVREMRDQTVRLLVQEQRDYNARVHHTAERAEQWLHWLPWLPLSLAIGAAIAHIVEHAKLVHIDERWLPMLTGFGILGPAFGAALHGFSGKAGFEESAIRADASVQQLDRFLVRLRDIDPSKPLASKALGDLTLELADVMGEDLAGWRVDYLARPANPPG